MVWDMAQSVASRGPGGDDIAAIHTVDESIHGLYARNGSSDDDGKVVEGVVVVVVVIGSGRRGGVCVLG